jgi:hypothetical protein
MAADTIKVVFPCAPTGDGDNNLNPAAKINVATIPQIKAKSRLIENRRINLPLIRIGRKAEQLLLLP